MSSAQERKKSLLEKWPYEKNVQMFRLFEKRPLLWNRTHPDNNNRAKMEQALREIGAHLGCDWQEAKLRFRYMRQTYLKYKQKPSRRPGGVCALDHWTFTKHCRFLSDEGRVLRTMRQPKYVQEKEQPLIQLPPPSPMMPNESTDNKPMQNVPTHDVTAPKPLRLNNMPEGSSYDEYDESGVLLATLLRRLGSLDRHEALAMQLKWEAECIAQTSSLFHNQRVASAQANPLSSMSAQNNQSDPSAGQHFIKEECLDGVL